MSTAVNIAIPAYGNSYHSVTVKSLFAAYGALQRQKIASSLSEISYADIVESRNYLLSNFFYNRQESHLLFVDTDMGFPPELIVDMIALDKPVVGVVAPRKAMNFAALGPGSNPKRALSYIHGKIEHDTLTNGFVRTNRCGAGILLLKRSCIEEMAAKIPSAVDTRLFKALPFGAKFRQFLRLFDRMQTETEQLSEDFSFCHRWTAACAGEIWVNVSHDIVHVGQQMFTGNYLEGGWPAGR